MHSRHLPQVRLRPKNSQHCFGATGRCPLHSALRDRPAGADKDVDTTRNRKGAFATELGDFLSTSGKDRTCTTREARPVRYAIPLRRIQSSRELTATTCSSNVAPERGDDRAWGSTTCEQAGCGYRADERQDQSGNSCDISVSRILEELREAHKLAGNHQDWAGSRTPNLPGSAGNMRSLLVSLPRV